MGFRVYRVSGSGLGFRVYRAYRVYRVCIGFRVWVQGLGFIGFREPAKFKALV